MAQKCTRIILAECIKAVETCYLIGSKHQFSNIEFKTFSENNIYIGERFIVKVKENGPYKRKADFFSSVSSIILSSRFKTIAPINRNTVYKFFNTCKVFQIHFI